MEIPVTVIKAGFNKGRQRFYPAETLKRDYKIFEGQKMFLNHPTDAESKARPEGSLTNWVAVLKNVFADDSGTIRGVATIIDPAFQKKVESLKAAGMLSHLGVSIRAAGLSETKNINGEKAQYVTSLEHARSVDFVTYPGAGGQATESYRPTVGNEFRESECGSAIDELNQRLVESFIAYGLSREEAEIAANLKVGEPW